jgi:carboxyl-terminal processing protease
MRAEEYFDEPSKRIKTDEHDSKDETKDTIRENSHSFKTAAGRVLYAGGGIMPDIYVSADTLAQNDFYYALRARGLFNEFVFNHLVAEKRPAALTEITETDLSEEEYHKFLAFVTQKGVKPKGSQATSARAAINKELKAVLARYYFGEEAYYKVVNSSDKVIARSLQELKQP